MLPARDEPRLPSAEELIDSADEFIAVLTALSFAVPLPLEDGGSSFGRRRRVTRTVCVYAEALARQRCIADPSAEDGREKPYRASCQSGAVSGWHPADRRPAARLLVGGSD
jgi:hypothetical protein